MADPSCQTRAERDSLSRYRAIFQSALDFAIVATDREGSITDWNRGAEAIFGWSAEEMLGQTVERFFTPEDRADGRVADEMLRALQDGRSDDERWHLRKDGTRFWANGETMPLRDGAGEQLGFLKIVRDETARHAAAEKQRADDEVMRGVLSASDDCIKVLDLDANLLFMSEGGQRVMEVDDFETIRGCPWPDFWQGELNHEAEAAVAAARAGRGAQFRGLTPTMAGNPRWWDVRLSPIFGRDGTPEKLLSISRDVTPAMVAEQALREGEAHWRGLFEKLQEGFLLGELVRDGDGHVVDWRYLDVNPAWGGLVGIAPGDAKGRTVRDVFPGIEDAWIDEMAAVVDTGEPAVFTRQVDTIDRWYEGRAFPLDGDRFAASFLEVTARRRAEIRQAALLELGDRLREARDPVAAAYAAGEILGRTLRVSRAGYGTIDPRDEVFAVERDWNAPGVTTLAGSLRFRDFGSYIEDLKRGETVSIDDAALDPRTAATSAELTAISARAFINMPVLEAGGFVALGYVNNVEPRIWTEHDIAFMRDVTERTRSAVERRRAENRLRDLAASLERQVTDRTQERDGVWRVSSDMLGIADMNSVWLNLNPAWTRVLGWDVDDFVGRTSAWVLHPDDRKQAQNRREAVATGTTVVFEGRYRTRAGDYRLLSWTATPSGGRIYSVARDVTEERAREAALRDSRDFARLALAAVGGIGVWTYDVSENLFRCDAAIADLYGVDPMQAAAGLPPAGFLANVHPDDRSRLSSTMATGMEREGSLELEYRIAHPNGSVRWVMSRGHTYFSDDGRPTRRTGVGIETTKQREMAEQLRQSQKMEAVGQLTGGLAHDFNNLLTGISGSLDMLGTRVRQGRTGELERYVVAAQGASKRAAALTHRLLAFSRRQTLDPKPTDVNRLVHGMADLIRRTVGPSITVETVDMAGLWTALVDPSQLENALLNLAINARDAMPDGGRITIETADQWLDEPAADERDLAPGQYLSLCVSDTGTGMPADVIARAFDPFFTTKPLGQGTGLGLSMIYGFARQSGGQVRIDSEVGLGTMVCIYLPRHCGDGEQAGEAPRRDGETPRANAGETVLVVDDEPTVRMLVADVLSDLGYSAIEAEDGPSGLRALQNSARVDLLVTDVGLPGGMNGRQVADAARALRPGLKVLFITGYAENAVVGNGHLDLGMEILTKPFAIDDLAARIRSLIES